MCSRMVAVLHEPEIRFLTLLFSLVGSLLRVRSRIGGRLYLVKPEMCLLVLPLGFSDNRFYRS